MVRQKNSWGNRNSGQNLFSKPSLFSSFSFFFSFPLATACKGGQKGCRMDHGINVLCLSETLVVADGDSSYERMSALLQTLERDHHHNSALLCYPRCTARPRIKAHLLANTASIGQRRACQIMPYASFPHPPPPSQIFGGAILRPRAHRQIACLASPRHPHRLIEQIPSGGPEPALSLPWPASRQIFFVSVSASVVMAKN